MLCFKSATFVAISLSTIGGYCSPSQYLLLSKIQDTIFLFQEDAFSRNFKPVSSAMIDSCWREAPLR